MDLVRNTEPAGTPLTQDEVIRLLSAHHSRLLGYIHVIVRDHGLTEDVMQETSVVVIRTAAEKTTRELFPAWVRRVARNIAFEALRERRHKLVAHVEPAVLDCLEAEWERWDEQERLAARKEALRACMEKLGASAREVLRLKYDREMSGAAIAEQLGRSVDGVYVTMSRIHKALAECIRARLAREAKA